MATAAQDRAIRIQEVCMRTGLSKTFIYSEVATGRFPAPRKIGPKISLWLESEIAEWLANLASRPGSGGKASA